MKIYVMGTYWKHLIEVIPIKATAYVLMENGEKYQQFFNEKCILSSTMDAAATSNEFHKTHLYQ